MTEEEYNDLELLEERQLMEYQQRLLEEAEAEALYEAEFAEEIAKI